MPPHIFVYVIMGLILLFSLVHLAVCLGIIIPFHQYGNIFQQPISLCGYNIFIAILGLVTGGLGLLYTFMLTKVFARVVCIVCGVLGIFTLASLMAAIILNAKSMDFITARFAGNMKKYQVTEDAQNTIDLIQLKYSCCGNALWLDWANVQLIPPLVTSTTYNSTTPIMTTNVTSTNSMNTNAATGASVTAGLLRNLGNVKRDITHISDNPDHQQSRFLADSSRKKRQGPETYGNIESLPLTFSILLPSTCCTEEAVLIGSTDDYYDLATTYCMSSIGGSVNSFYTIGCAKQIQTDAGNQLLGVAVINCFLLVLTFVAIPIVIEDIAS